MHRNIRSFGGDPENITIFGESAGGASVNYQVKRRRKIDFNKQIEAESSQNVTGPINFICFCQRSCGPDSVPSQQGAGEESHLPERRRPLPLGPQQAATQDCTAGLSPLHWTFIQLTREKKLKLL